MKRVISLGFLVLISLSFVSAYYGGGWYSDPIYGFGRGMEQLIEFTEVTLGPFFSVVLGGYGDLLFERVLFLFIVLAVVYVISSKMDVFKDNKLVIWTVTLAISLLSVRFLTDELIQTMILPYNILGVSISAILPLIIYFTFVESFSDSATLRKTLWLFFMVVFIGIWGSRYDELGDLSWIYFFTAVAALIFLLADGTIRRAIENQQLKQLGYEKRQQYIADLHDQLDKLHEQVGKNHITVAYFNSRKKDIEKQLKDYMKG
jgi:hypothetical protein